MRIHIPKDIVYTCIQCGLCCEDHWEIQVDEESKKRIEHFDLPVIRDIFENTPAFEKSPGDPGTWILHMREGRCCFLDGQNMCLLHVHHGYDSKPETCKNFPFSYRITSTGDIYVRVSFACRAVINNEGAHLREYVKYFNERIGKHQKVSSLPDKVILEAGVEIPWETYLEIEKRLSYLIGLEVYTIEDCLIGGKIYLDLLINFIKEAQQSGQYSIEEVVDTFIKKMEEDHYHLIIRLAKKPLHRPSLQRAFLGMIVAFRNSVYKKRSSLSTFVYLLYQYWKHICRIGKVRLLPVEGKFKYSDFKHVRWDIEEPRTSYQLRRYFQHLLFAKDPVLRASFVQGYTWMMMYYALIRWYAVAQAAVLGAEEVTRHEVDEAIRMVDQYYVAHTNFITLFERYPVLANVTESFFNKKVAVPSLVRPAV